VKCRVTWWKPVFRRNVSPLHSGSKSKRGPSIEQADLYVFDLRFSQQCFWDIAPLKVKRRLWGTCGKQFGSIGHRIFLSWLILRPWRWRRHVPPKRWSTFSGLHGFISQKMERFETTAYCNNNCSLRYIWRTGGSIVDWGATLQAGRSRVQFPMKPFNISMAIALGSTQPLTEMGTRNLPGGNARPEHKADLTAICEPIVSKMLDPGRLTTLWASTACYCNNLTFYLSVV
jgi:hypothetical protein